MNPTTFDYYSFRETKIRNKIKEELDLYENGEFAIIKDLPPMNQYIEYLKVRIGTNSKYKAKYVCRSHEPIIMSEYSKNLDTMTYKRPWNKLKDVHKIAKIKDYVNNLSYNKISDEKMAENQTIIIDQLCEGLKEKRFVKNKSVIEYDTETMTITGISCLSMAKNGLYEIDWDD